MLLNVPKIRKICWENKFPKQVGRTKFQSRLVEPRSKTDWENQVPKHARRTKFQNRLGEPSSKTDWENQIPKQAGTTKVQNRLGEPSSKTGWVAFCCCFADGCLSEVVLCAPVFYIAKRDGSV